MIKKIFLFFLIINYNFLEAKPKNKKIVFMGNSITQMWSDNSFFFKSNPSFINKGISGQTTPQMLMRFDDDVIKENANTVIILAGINDIAQNTGPIQVEDIADNIFSMAEMAQKNNINVFICSVLPANRILWNKSIKPTYKVIKLNMLLKEFCKNKNIEYVDYYSEMVDWNGGLKSPLYTSKWDLVHPNKKGYEKMEEILIKKIKKEL
jgi:lysophospholipase L1-like esterase